MKPTRFPSLVLPLATTLASLSVLGADPAAVAPPSAAMGAASAVRGALSSAEGEVRSQQERTETASAPRRTPAGAKAASEMTEPSEFSFVPPDPEFFRNRPGKLEELNGIGRSLVDFAVHSGRKVLERQEALQKQYVDDRQETLDRAKAEAIVAGDRRRTDELAYSEADSAIREARDAFDLAAEEEARAEAELDRIEKEIKEDSDNANLRRERKEALEAQFRGVKDAETAAAAESGEARGAFERANSEWTAAVARHAEATNAVVNGRTRVDAAERTLKEGEERAEQSGATALAAREESDAAEKSRRAAERAEKGARRNLERAEREQSAAAAAVREAKDRKERMAQRLETARKANAETKGWFSRLWIPSVPRAERRLAAAEEEIPAAESRAGEATAKAKTAAAAAAAAETSLKEAVAKAEEASGKAKAAAEEAKTARESVQGFRDERNTARRMLQAAEREVPRASRSVADSDAARKEAGDAFERLDAARKEAEERTRTLESEIQVLDSTKDAELSFRLHEADKNKAKKELLDAVEAREKASLQKEEAEANKDDTLKAKLDASVAKEKVALVALREAGESMLAAARDSEFDARREIRDLGFTNEVARAEYWSNLRRDVGDELRAAASPESARSASDRAFADYVARTNELATARSRLRDVRSKISAAEKAVSAAEREARSAASALRTASNAVVRAAARVEEAVARETAARAATEGAKDADRAGAALRDATAARADAEKAAEDAAKARSAAEQAAAAANDRAGEERQRLESDRADVESCQKAERIAAGAVDEAESLLRKARASLADAERDGRQADRAADRTVDPVEREFDRQLQAKIAEWRTYEAYRRLSESGRIRLLALEARREYRAALAEYRDRKRDYYRQLDREADHRAGLESGSLEAFRNAYSAARRRFSKAEAKYNEYFSDNTFRTDRSDDTTASNRLDTVAARIGRDHDGLAVQFRGDRLWLARTSVNGAPLLDSFKEELDWQIGLLRRPMDDVASLEEKAPASEFEAVKAAADHVRARAIYGGFYFAGLEVREQAARSFEVFVDKGRFSPGEVRFVDSDGVVLRERAEEGEVPVEARSGKEFSEAEILSRLAPRGAGTNNLEREAFNFVEFRRNLNALNADPDIRRADVTFTPQPAGEWNYGYDEDPSLTNRNTRAVKTAVTVEEDPSWLNRLLPRPVSPLHGVIGIDNFNSMGDSDRIAGDADTWSARATVQNQHRFLGRDAALTLNGNVSLAASLYGGAASWYLARRDDLGWNEGGWKDWALTVHGGYTDVDQEDVIEGLDVLGTGYYAGLQATSRMADFGGSTLDFSMGLTYRYVESKLRLANTTLRMGPGENGDGYTILPLSLALLYADKDLDALGGRNYATLELAYNLGGSSADDLRYFRQAIQDGDDAYLLLRAQFARIQLLFLEETSFLLPRLLFLRADAQYAFAPVVGSEQFGLGGHGTVRGYVEREFMGDTGLSATLEFRTPIRIGWLSPSAKPDRPYEGGDSLQLVYFLDMGYYLLEDAHTVRAADGSAVLEDDDNLLLGLGFGVRYSWKDLVARLDWGFPVWQETKLEDSETSSSGVVHASLQYQF